MLYLGMCDQIFLPEQNYQVKNYPNFFKYLQTSMDIKQSTCIDIHVQT